MQQFIKEFFLNLPVPFKGILGAKFPNSRKSNAMTVYMLPIWIFVDTFVLLFSGLMFKSVSKLDNVK